MGWGDTVYYVVSKALMDRCQRNGKSELWTESPKTGTSYVGSPLSAFIIGIMESCILLLK